MARSDLYLKVELEHEREEALERIIAEIDRQIRRVHGVRAVEFSHAVPHSGDPA